ncbi:hypothetical protein CGRA01v4_02095 [Colletotrichum graminicola]|nr:hypothetical protein CGRA01v4_02095 [Colletotrichum graminicola]
MISVLSSRQGPDNSACPKDCVTQPCELQANADVSGIGVLIGFMGTGWLAILIVLFRYFLTFDPTAHPFTNSKQDGRHSHQRALKPNALDVKITSMFKRLRQLVSPHSY